MLSIRYDRNSVEKPPPRLRPCQHLWSDTRGTACPTQGARVQQDLPREGERRPARPARTAQAAESRRSRRCGDGDPHRPPGPLDVRPVCHREADRGCGRPVLLIGRAMGRHRHQYRAADARRPGWTGGCRTRSDQDPYGRRAKPGAGPRAADGPAAETHAPAASVVPIVDYKSLRGAIASGRLPRAQDR